jgi:hypothetical protein
MIPGIGGQRGYVSFGTEHAKGRKEGDLKILAFRSVCERRVKIRFRIS